MTLISPARFRVTKADLAAPQTDPARQAALGVMAHPTHSVVLTVVRAGDAAATETTFFAAGADAPVVAQSGDAETADLAAFPSVALATVAIDERVGLSELPAISGDVLELDLTAFAALLAVADAERSALLRAELAREVRPRPVITSELLEASLREGLAGRDTRWSVTAAAAVTPVDLRSATGAMAAGLGELLQERLVAPVEGGYTLTPDGRLVAATLGQLVTVARLTLVRPEGTVAPLTVLRAATAVWLCSWEGERVTLVPATVAGALTAVRRMLEGGGAAPTVAPGS